MNLKVASLLLAVTVSLAGCAGGGDPDPVDPGSTPTTTETNGELPPPEPQPTTVERDLFLTSSGELSPDIPSAGSAPAVGNLVTDLLIEDLGYMAFTSGAFQAPAVIPAGTYELGVWFQSTSPMVSPGISDFVAWIGSTANMVLGNVVAGTTLPTGTEAPFEVTYSLAIPVDVYVPQGEAFELRVAAFTTHLETGSLQMLFGPDHPSRLNFTWIALPDDPLANVGGGTTETFTGHLDSGSISPVPLGVQSIDFSFEVPADASVVRLTSTATGTTRVDFDMYVRGGGTLVGQGVGGGSVEGIVLAGPVLEPYLGTSLDLQATAFAGFNIDFEIDVEIA